MPKQILMPENEFETLLEEERRKAVAQHKKWFVEDLWPVVFPTDAHSRGKSLDVLWLALLNEIVGKFRGGK